MIHNDLIDGYDVILNGANKPTSGGLWMCKNLQPSFFGTANFCEDFSNIVGGHEVVVIGYDDDQELFKIRNSWGKDVGDQGDFFMTYAYYVYMTNLVTVLNFEN